MVIQTSHDDVDAFDAAKACGNTQFDKILREARFTLNGEKPPAGYNFEYAATKWECELDGILARLHDANKEHPTHRKASEADISAAQAALAAELAGLTFLDAAAQKAILQDFIQAAAGKTVPELGALRANLSQQAAAENNKRSNELAETGARTAEEARHAAEAKLWGEIHELDKAIAKDLKKLHEHGLISDEEFQELDAERKRLDRMDPNDPARQEGEKKYNNRLLANAKKAYQQASQNGDTSGQAAASQTAINATARCSALAKLEQLPPNPCVVPTNPSQNTPGKTPPVERGKDPSRLGHPPSANITASISGQNSYDDDQHKPNERVTLAASQDSTIQPPNKTPPVKNTDANGRY